MRISVIIPVYNTIRYLENCVQSILNQTYKNIEIVLVDDGSTDGSSALCDKLARNHAEIMVYHQKNGGVSSARNTGILRATGDYMLFLDSDDQLAVEALSKSAELIEKYNCDMVAWSLVSVRDGKCNYFHMSESFTVASQENPDMLEDLRYRAISGYSHSGKKDYSMNFLVNKVIRREILIKNNLFFDTSIKYHEDTLFVMKLVELISSAVAIDECYYIRTLREGSATASPCTEIRTMNEHVLNEMNLLFYTCHANQPEYAESYVKQKFASFLQILSLDYLNPSLDYSFLQRKRSFNSLVKDPLYKDCLSISGKEYGIKYKIMSLCMRFRVCSPFYVMIKILESRK